MSAEDYEALKELSAEHRRERQIEGERRRNRNADIFYEAAQLAEANGLRLRRCSPQHYQLFPETADDNGRWLLHLYPGNQRLLRHEPGPHTPFLRLPKPWTLLDAVQAVVAKRLSLNKGKVQG